MHAGLPVAGEVADGLTPAYRPARATGVAVGLALVAAILLAAAVLGWRAGYQPMGPTLFAHGLSVIVLLAVAGLTAYWLYGCFNLAYAVRPDALVVRWAGEQHAIPMGEIERLVPGDAVVLRSPDGVDWPGYHVGPAVVPELGPVLFFSTHRRADEVTYVVTPSVTYALAARQSWLESALVAAADLGESTDERGAELPLGTGEPGAEAPTTSRGAPGFVVGASAPGPVRAIAPRPGAAAMTAALPIAVRRWRLLDLPLWSDRPALVLLGAGLALNLLLFNVLQSAYPALPELLPVHFTPGGEVARIGARDELLRLPIMALAVWIANGALAGIVRGRERLAALLLLGAGAGFQILFLVAAMKLAG